MDYFTKWPAAYEFPNQETSTVTEELFTNFCHFQVSRDLRSDQGLNSESRLIEEVFQRLALSKTRTTPLHAHWESMVERCVKTVEEHVGKFVASRQRDWEARLSIFLLAYRISLTKPRTWLRLE
jgi:hypothetical protein